MSLQNAVKIVIGNKEVQKIESGSTTVWERAVPAGYDELEYVQASNSQYFFVTGFKLSNLDEVEAVIAWNNAAGNTFGCFSSSSATDNFCLYAGSSSSDAYIRYDGELKRSFRPTSGTKYKIVQNADGFFANDTTIATFAPATFTCANDFGVCQLTGSSSAKFTGKLYDIKVRRGAALRMHLIPAKRLSDNKVGMYDAVGGNFYTSASNTAFVAGGVVG